MHITSEIVAIVAGITLIFATVLGGVIGLARAHIKGRVQAEVGEALTRQLEPLNLSIIATNGELERNQQSIQQVEKIVIRLESKIENGMSHRQERLEEKVNSIVNHLMPHRD
jgi:hypothetical protein